MKKIILLLVSFALYSCNKTGTNSENLKNDSVKIIDSINAARTKHNDSIKILNSKNVIRDLSGNHQLSHSSIAKKGNLNFKNIGRDLYAVSGEAKSGKNYVKIEGEIKMVSEEFLNFTGKVTQSLQENDNGKIDVRTKKTSFAKKGNRNFWRFQNRVNSSGFADDIDIY